MKISRALETALLVAMVACKGKDAETPRDGKIDLGSIDASDCINPMIEKSDLETAIWTGDAACVKKTVEKFKINLNEPLVDTFGKRGDLPLTKAFGHLSFAASSNKGDSRTIVALLISLGANPNARNPKSRGGIFDRDTGGPGKTMLELALNVGKDYVEVKRYMIALPDVDVNLEGSEYYPVEIAMQQGDVESAEALINRGASVTLHKAPTPLLHAAIRSKQESVARLLLSKGADQNELDSAQRPLDLSIDYGLEDLAIHLIERGAKFDYVAAGKGSVLHDSISAKMPKLTQLLLDRGLSPNAQDSTGSTPLHLAIRTEDSRTLQVLLNAKANLEISDKSGQTPLYVAVAKGQMDNVRTLIGARAKVNVTDQNRRGLIQTAPSSEIALALIAAGAPVDDASNDGETAISAHVAAGRSDVVKALKDRGANLQWKDKSGRSLLFGAVRGDWLATAQYLVANGLSADATDKEGNTPLFLAYSVEMLDYLLSQGADINHLNRERDSALSARVPGHDGRASLLKEFLDRGADINWMGKGTSYLIETVRGYRPQMHMNGSFVKDQAENYVATIQTLLKAGIDHSRLELTNGLPAVQFIALNAFSLRTEGGVNMLRALIDGGVDANQKGRDGSTLGKKLQATLIVQEKEYAERLKAAEQVGNKELIERVNNSYLPYIKNLRDALALIP